MPKEYLKSIHFKQIERNQTSELLTLQMQTPLAVFGFINDLYFNQALQLWNHNHLHLNCVHHLGHLFVCFFFSTWVGIMNVSYQAHSHIFYHDMIHMKLKLNSKCFMKHTHMNVLSAERQRLVWNGTACILNGLRTIYCGLRRYILIELCFGKNTLSLLNTFSNHTRPAWMLIESSFTQLAFLIGWSNIFSIQK